MSELRHRHSELLQLLGQLREEQLNDVEGAQLQQLLKANEDARLIYVRYMNLVAGLHWDRAADRGAAVKISFEIAVVQTTSPAVRAIVKPLVLRSFKTLTSSVRNSAIAATLLVALTLYGAFGYLAWDLRSKKLFFTGNELPVARINEASNVEWSPEASPKLEESFIRPGETLKIASGQIELSLGRGASLLVEGPAEWSIDDDNGATLKVGKIVASVPSQAVGFTLSTPTARIVDLGTEFGVEVSKSGTTEVQVSQGKVELHPGRRTSAALAPLPLTLSAGSARRIEFDEAKGAVVVHSIAPVPHHFAQRMRSLKSHQLAAGALASSEGAREWGREANNLVNGRGLSKGEHTNVADGTMWHSAYGKVKGEFVLFDLFRPCRLESMKVWNYNENVHPGDGHLTNLFEDRGVAQADIYVSTTGKGNPISQPHEWQLIVENGKFAPADGTSTFAAPEVVPLGNVEARFVAIVIESRHHPERISPGMECVGLSEVQFFGERVPLKESSKRN